MKSESVDVKDVNDSVRCTRCSAELTDVTGGIGQCQKCANEGYRPPLVSGKRNIVNSKHDKNGVVLSDYDACTHINKMAIPCASDLKCERHIQTVLSACEAPDNFAAVCCFEHHDETVVGAHSNQDSAHSTNFSESNCHLSCPEQQSVFQDAKFSVSCGAASNPDSCLVSDVKVTRRLWNQIDALQRDEDIDVRCHCVDDGQNDTDFENVNGVTVVSCPKALSEIQNIEVSMEEVACECEDLQVTDGQNSAGDIRCF